MCVCVYCFEDVERFPRTHKNARARTHTHTHTHTHTQASTYEDVERVFNKLQGVQGVINAVRKTDARRSDLVCILESESESEREREGERERDRERETETERERERDLIPFCFSRIAIEFRFN